MRFITNSIQQTIAKTIQLPLMLSGYKPPTSFFFCSQSPKKIHSLIVCAHMNYYYIKLMTVNFLWFLSKDSIFIVEGMFLCRNFLILFYNTAEKNGGRNLIVMYLMKTLCHLIFLLFVGRCCPLWNYTKCLKFENAFVMWFINNNSISVPLICKFLNKIAVMEIFHFDYIWTLKISPAVVLILIFSNYYDKIQ